MCLFGAVILWGGSQTHFEPAYGDETLWVPLRREAKIITISVNQIV